MVKAQLAKVLLIDDEAEFASTLAERLILRGFAATVATEGISALSMLEQEHFDIVLLDMMLPGMRGTDILARIRKKSKELPVILLTGHASSQSGMVGMQEGANSYLIKPIDIEELLEIMHELLKGKNNA